MFVVCVLCVCEREREKREIKRESREILFCAMCVMVFEKNKYQQRKLEKKNIKE